MKALPAFDVWSALGRHWNNKDF